MPNRGDVVGQPVSRRTRAVVSIHSPGACRAVALAKVGRPLRRALIAFLSAEIVLQNFCDMCVLGDHSFIRFRTGKNTLSQLGGIFRNLSCQRR
jgi:hypothetical protein